MALRKSYIIDACVVEQAVPVDLFEDDRLPHRQLQKIRDLVEDSRDSVEGIIFDALKTIRQLREQVAEREDLIAAQAGIMLRLADKLLLDPKEE